MQLNVEIEPAAGAPPRVEYRWDTDTDILTASVAPVAPAEGPPGVVELQGRDGSWVILEVRGGRIRGVEVAVWPDVRKLPVLLPPTGERGDAILPPERRSAAVLEIDAPLSAEVDAPERTIHFRLGVGTNARAVRVASDLLLDVEPSGGVAGIWLLNVPPFPLDQ